MDSVASWCQGSRFLYDLKIDGRALTPTQWLPKSATKWMPQEENSLREAWSHPMGEGDTLNAVSENLRLWSLER